MIVKLLTEHHLEVLSLKGGCRGSSESTLVKIPHCWKSHALAHLSCFGLCWHCMKRRIDPNVALRNCENIYNKQFVFFNNNIRGSSNKE